MGNNVKFLVLGASGMAGNMIYSYLKERGYECVGLDKHVTIPGCLSVDATNFNALDDVIKNENPDIIINCIGILNQFAEDNKELAIKLNSLLPIHLEQVTKDTKIRVFQMSTDCVFSGSRGAYTEEDLPDGRTWYDRTKAMGELRNNKDLTFRNSIIGPDTNVNGIGLFNWFMKQEGNISGYTKAMWTGVTTLELAKAMEKAAHSEVYGLFNCVNNTSISKYKMLCLFKKYMQKDKIIINKNETVVVDKSLRRTNFDFDYAVPSYEQMIKEMSEWIYQHKEMYPHYFN